MQVEQSGPHIRHVELLEKLTACVCDVLRISQVDTNLAFAAIGIDSLNIVDVIISCEQIYREFAIDASALELDESTTILELHHQLVAFGV